MSFHRCGVQRRLREDRNRARYTGFDDDQTVLEFGWRRISDRHGGPGLTTTHTERTSAGKSDENTPQQPSSESAGRFRSSLRYLVPDGGSIVFGRNPHRTPEFQRCANHNTVSLSARSKTHCAATDRLALRMLRVK